jgi:hypothetical protein
MKCKKCETEFKKRFYLNGKRYDYRKRIHCYNCKPLRMIIYNKELVIYLYGSEDNYNNELLQHKEQNLAQLEKNKKSSKRIYKECEDCKKAFNIRLTEKICRNCKRKNYRRIKQWATKIAFIEYKGGKCQQCGWVPKDKADYVCLDFHHRDPSTKEFNLSRIKSYSDGKIIRELLKCDLLCVLCHRKHHQVYKYNGEELIEVLKYAKNIKLKLSTTPS